MIWLAITAGVIAYFIGADRAFRWAAFNDSEATAWKAMRSAIEYASIDLFLTLFIFCFVLSWPVSMFIVRHYARTLIAERVARTLSE